MFLFLFASDFFLLRFHFSHKISPWVSVWHLYPLLLPQRCFCLGKPLWGLIILLLLNGLSCCTGLLETWWQPTAAFVLCWATLLWKIKKCALLFQYLNPIEMGPAVAIFKSNWRSYLSNSPALFRHVVMTKL